MSLNCIQSMDLWQHQLELAVWLVHEACNRFLILPQLYQELSPAPPEKTYIQTYSLQFCPSNIKTTKSDKWYRVILHNSVLLVIIKFNFWVQLTANANVFLKLYLHMERMVEVPNQVHAASSGQGTSRLTVPEIRKTYLSGTIKTYYWKFSANS